MVSNNPNPCDGFYLDPSGMALPGLGPFATTMAASTEAAAAEDLSKKIRKPYTITKSRESWTDPEHDKFLEALTLFDRDWKKIEAFIGSKTVIQDSCGFVDEKCESKLYIGNLDLRITEAVLIKMFSPFGKIISEDFLWHTRGPKRGEPRGFAFIEYSSKEEAKLAKEKMHGKLARGRPLVVRLASEKLTINTTKDSSREAGESSKSRLGGSNYGQMTRSDKIAAIKNKLRALEGGGEGSSVKKQKQDHISCRDNVDKSSLKTS